MEEVAHGVPYVVGQEPGPCGHYYPDVFRIRDEKINDQCFRMIHCEYCGFYHIKLNCQKAGGPETWLDVEDIERVRAEEKEQMLKLFPLHLEGC